MLILMWRICANFEMADAAGAAAPRNQPQRGKSEWTGQGADHQHWCLNIEKSFEVDMPKTGNPQTTVLNAGVALIVAAGWLCSAPVQAQTLSLTGYKQAVAESLSEDAEMAAFYRDRGFEPALDRVGPCRHGPSRRLARGAGPGVGTRASGLAFQFAELAGADARRPE